MTDSLARLTARAGLWAVGGKLLAKAVDFVTLLVLARLLGPADFGLVSMAMISVFIVEAVLDLPIAAALIRIEKPTPAMFSTAFTLSLMRGFVVALALGALAWPMAIFYHEPRLVPLVCVLAIAPVMRGLVSPRMILFVQHFDLRRDFALDVGSKLVALPVAIGIAYFTGSYWAIAAGTITTPVVMVLLSYHFAPLRPSLTLSARKIFVDMLSWNTVAQLFLVFNWQMDKLLLGKFVDLTAFGRYSMANDLAAIPSQAIVQPISRPLLATFAASHTTASLRSAYLHACATIVMVVCPILACLSLLAEPVVRLLLGEQWMAAADMLRWLALVGIIGLVAIPSTPLALNLNRTRFVTLRTGVEAVVKLPLMTATVALMGIPGALLTQAVVACVATAVAMWTVRQLIGISVRAQLRALHRPLTALVPLVLCLAPATHLLRHVVGWLPLAVATGVFALTGMTVYAIASMLLWKHAGSPPGLEQHLDQYIRRTFARWFGSRPV